MNPTISLSQAAQLFLEYLQAQGKHPRTLATYYRDLSQIQAFFGPERTIDTLSLPFIGRFLKSGELLLRSNGTPRASQTVNKTIRVFRMLMTWLHQSGFLSELILPKSMQNKRLIRGDERFTKAASMEYQSWGIPN
jgi:site-specific recombinase XerD